MTDYNDLRRLAEAAASGPWWTSDKLKCRPDLELSDDTAYIAAASPEVVLGLLDEIEVLEGWYATVSGQRRAAEAERDQLRAVAVRLKEVLEIMAAQTSGITGSTARADCMASIASIALADPEVEKL